MRGLVEVHIRIQKYLFTGAMFIGELPLIFHNDKMSIYFVHYTFYKLLHFQIQMLKVKLIHIWNFPENLSSRQFFCKKRQSDNDFSKDQCYVLLKTCFRCLETRSQISGKHFSCWIRNWSPAHSYWRS